MGLQQFERKLERLVEGVFAKAFRSGVTPVEVAKRIAREMDANRLAGVRDTIVPNHFTVSVSAKDHEQLVSLSQTLTRDLGEYAREHAKTEGYKFVGPLDIGFETLERLGAGEFLVAGEVREAEGGVAGSIVLADGSRVTVGAEPITIGRLNDCEVILSDPNVSRRHAEVRREADGFIVVDLGSMNGTLVNERRVSEHRLAEGDEIRVGDSRMRFEAS